MDKLAESLQVIDEVADEMFGETGFVRVIGNAWAEYAELDSLVLVDSEDYDRVEDGEPLPYALRQIEEYAAKLRLLVDGVRARAGIPLPTPDFRRRREPGSLPLIPSVEAFSAVVPFTEAHAPQLALRTCCEGSCTCREVPVEDRAMCSQCPTEMAYQDPPGHWVCPSCGHVEPDHGDFHELADGDGES